jgi:hypothetical protein
MAGRRRRIDDLTSALRAIDRNDLVEVLERSLQSAEPDVGGSSGHTASDAAHMDEITSRRHSSPTRVPAAISAGMVDGLPAVIQMNDWSPLGIRRVIRLSDRTADYSGQPAYVRRDFDPQLRSAVAAARTSSVFVLLIGAAATGKTRSAYEAVRAELPDWRLLLPESPVDLAVLTAEDAALDQVVIWLDDLYAHLEQGWLSPALVHRDRSDRHRRVLLIATVWLDDYERLCVPPATSTGSSAAVSAEEIMTAPWPAALAAGRARADTFLLKQSWPAVSGRIEIRPGVGAPDTWGPARKLLQLATDHIWVSDRISPAERRRAATIADTDSRIADAVRHDEGSSFPVVLAAMQHQCTDRANCARSARRRGRDMATWRRACRSRCQCSTVSGRISSVNRCGLARGSVPSSAAGHARSAGANRTRCPPSWRCNTAI